MFKNKRYWAISSEVSKCQFDTRETFNDYPREEEYTIFDQYSGNGRHF